MPVTTLQCIVKVAVQSAGVRSSTGDYTGDEAQATDRRLQVLNHYRILPQTAKAGESVAPPLVTDCDGARVDVNDVAEVLEAPCRPRRLPLGYREAEPLEDGHRTTHGRSASRAPGRGYQEIVHVHAAVDADGGEKLHHFARQGAGEGRRQPQSEREPVVYSKRAASLRSPLTFAVSEPRLRGLAGSSPCRVHARISYVHEVLDCLGDRQRGEVLGQVAAADVGVVETPQQTDRCVDPFQAEPPVRHGVVDAGGGQVDDRPHWQWYSVALMRPEVRGPDDCMHRRAHTAVCHLPLVRSQTA